MEESVNLALFDFDGTITTQDAYTRFVFYSASKPRIVLGFMLIWPVILFYKIGLLPASKTRPILSKVAYWRRDVADIERLAEQYCDEFLSKVVRRKALERIEWHKGRGDKIYVVSASVSPYLRIWCQRENIELICSELESKGSRYTGSYVQGDCSLERKVTFLRQREDLTQFATIYAYGDTEEDTPMLSIADVKYYCWQRMEGQLD
jgi:HAD superfamily hydrolase (TIGR01490 family)